MFERKNWFSYLWQSKDIRKKIIITFVLVGLYRFLLVVPLPGIVTTPDLIKQNIGSDSGLNTLLDFLSMLSGSSLLRVSVLALGLLPFNLTGIVLSTLASLIPGIQRRFEEDPREARKSLERWNYYLAIPIAILESFLFLFIISPNCEGRLSLLEGSTAGLSPIFTISTVLLLTAGSFFAVWIAGLISEYGIRGQGNMILLASNLIAQMPNEIARLFKPVWTLIQMPNSLEKRLAIPDLTGSLIMYPVLFLLCILVVVYLLGGRRNIPVAYPGRRTGARMNMPVRGSLPLTLTIGEDGLLGSQLIVALATFYAPLITCTVIPWLNAAATWTIKIFSDNSIYFGPIVFFSVVLFTYYFADTKFQALEYGEGLKRVGASIPGVNRGVATQRYLNRVNRNITLLPALLLGFLAVVPWLFNMQFGYKLSLLDGEILIIIVMAIRNAYYSVDAELLVQGYDRPLLY